MSASSMVCNNENNNHSKYQSEARRIDETRNCLSPVYPGRTVSETLVVNLGGMAGEICQHGQLSVKIVRELRVLLGQ